MFSVYAGKLRAELLQQQALFQAGQWEYCKAVTRRHRKRVLKTVGVVMLMNALGYGLLVYSVSSLGLNKSLANPMVGLIMFPVGMALNHFVVFKDQDTDMFNLDPDDMFGGGGRWLVKTLGFTALGQGSYQIMVTLLDWNYKGVRIGQMCVLGPLSLAANYLVFRRRVKKAQKAPDLKAVTDMA